MSNSTWTCLFWKYSCERSSQHWVFDMVNQAHLDGCFYPVTLKRIKAGFLNEVPNRSSMVRLPRAFVTDNDFHPLQESLQLSACTGQLPLESGGVRWEHTCSSGLLQRSGAG
jgi:hypothetical protein